MTVPVGAAGVRGLGGRGYLAYAGGVGAVGRGGSNSASYGLKADKQVEEKLYDLLPGMELTPMNPAAMNLKAAAIKPAPQVTHFSPPVREPSEAKGRLLMGLSVGPKGSGRVVSEE